MSLLPPLGFPSSRHYITSPSDERWEVQKKEEGEKKAMNIKLMKNGEYEQGVLLSVAVARGC